MSIVAINTKVATITGWTDVHLNESTRLLVGKNPKTGYEAPVPNYFESLAAMHEAELTLDVEQREVYLEKLYQVTNPDSVNNGAWNLNTASAANRAEAFLRTFGEW